LPDEPFPRAEIVEMVDPPAPAGVASMIEAVAAALHEVRVLSGRLQGIPGEPTALRISPDPEQAAFEVAALTPLGALDAQRVLELPDTESRLRALREFLSDAATLLRARLDEPDGG